LEAIEMPILDDTIAAIATAPGAGGLAVVRVSGPRALAVADAVFRGGASLASAPSHTLHHGWAVWPCCDGPRGAAPDRSPGRRLDEVVAAVFRAPRSYTCEDVVEVSCHGGELPSRQVLAGLLAAGARLAGPGEFTLRAFLHGRIDLSQAEAVADVIAASTSRAHELALSQLSGALALAVEALADRLTDAVAEVEARVDFAEDVGGIEVPAHVVALIGALDGELAALLGTTTWACAVREGVRVPLVGRPNVGKSSLFNALLGEARAIVSDTPGTTRDRVSEAIELAGIRVTLSDTAGLRETDDAVESIGVERAYQAVAGSALALWVVDGAAPLADEDRRIAERLAGRRVLVALNKCDQPISTTPDDVASLLDGTEGPIVAVSATTGDGVESLRAALTGLLGGSDRADGLGIAVGNLRHAEAMGRARAALARAARAAGDRLPGEIVALELREALAALGEVTGRSVDDDLLDRIFHKFCVGK
jgi:tRNA modification GTPase